MHRRADDRPIETSNAAGDPVPSATKPEHRPLVLIGSARKGGDTYRLVNTLFAADTTVVCDLSDHKIHPYDYTGRYPADDVFGQLTDQLLTHQVLVWATPVYWYAMSGTMKIVFDRFTDLVTTHRHLGRRLAGKRMFLAAVGAEPCLPEGFDVPFKRTAEYLDMHYGGAIYATPEYIGNVLDEAHTQNWLGRLNAVSGHSRL